jgi:hypothetical protein
MLEDLVVGLRHVRLIGNSSQHANPASGQEVKAPSNNGPISTP